MLAINLDPLVDFFTGFEKESMPNKDQEIELLAGRPARRNQTANILLPDRYEGELNCQEEPPCDLSNNWRRVDESRQQATSC